MKLSWLKIFNIDDIYKVPTFCWKEILSSIGIDDVNKIELYHIPNIDKNQLSCNDFQHLARFFHNNNINIKWDKKTLIETFYFYLSLIKNEEKLYQVILNTILNNEEIDLPDKYHPYRINKCLLFLFTLNQKWNIPLDIQMNTLIDNLKLYFTNDPVFIIKIIQHNININTIPNHLMNLLFSLSIKKNKIDLTKNIPEKRDNKYLSYRSKYIKNHLNEVPQTTTDVIINGALKFDVDLTQSYNPFDDWKLLNEGKNIQNCIFLNHEFNPDLPVELYTSKCLSQLINNEGFQCENVFKHVIKGQTSFSFDDQLKFDHSFFYPFTKDNQYQLLQIIINENTFFNNIPSKYENDQTCITFDLVKDVPSLELVSFGKLNSDNNYIFTYNELLDTFSFYHQFIDPRQQMNEFSTLSIIKLRHLCQLSIRQNENNDMYQIRQQLLKEINSIWERQDKLSIEGIQLQTLFIKNPDIIYKFFSLLLKIGMLMRGWDEKSPYPITSAPMDDYEQVFTRINLHLVEFVNMMLITENDSCIDKDIKRFLYNLPLFIYRDKIFIQSNNYEEGLTIKERIDILSRGESDTNMSSCIRLTSNWLCSTYFYYWNIILKRSKIFDIREMALIG